MSGQKEPATACPACGGEPFPSKPDDETLACQECGQEWPANEEVNMPEFPRMPDADVRTIAQFLGVDEDVVYAVLTFHRWFLTGRITPPDSGSTPNDQEPQP